jgi:N-acetylmuramoyl-L-alanine amidase
LDSVSRERSLRLLGILACFALFTAALPAHARVHHSEGWAREHFASAERMREALNGRSPTERTRHDYQRVVNAYRAVYLGAPNSTKADPSVVAVAETMVEMGRRFEDDQILNKAIDEYKFLRREYPGSKYRFDGLFTIGEIYKDDLDNPKAARTTFEEFLRRYPHNRLADDARKAIAELTQVTDVHESKTRRKNSEKTTAEESSNREDDSRTAAGTSQPSREKAKASTAQASAPWPRVTGIRHWSTPDYTRVVIDVEGEVKFSSQRIASPARIYFDLKDTKLASTLVGKSFDVDDGFLRKIRVAQFAPGRTRVVLDVDDLSVYDAFLLPNPYRLIIDIHGKNSSAREFDSPSLANHETSASSDASELPVADLPGSASLGETDAANTKAPDASSEDKRTSTAVVKKIVDADDDSDDSLSENEIAPPPRHTKKITSHDGILVDKVSKTDIDDSPAESALSALKDSPASAHRKTTPRALASSKSESADDFTVREARPTSAGDRSLIRALGLKIGKIVIDPGHGGHDTGTIGPNGLEEKDLVLEVGRRLGKLLETRLGAEVVYTRKDDTFIPLETRTAIANQARADLFISIHANSSHDADARGVETYYLNFTSSPDALEVAARENAVSEKSIYELQDLVKKIAMKEKIEESREFAADVESSLHSGLAAKSPAIRDRGVKKAPFIVLIGANMPSILAEISFVSNPADERRLETSEYRERIAESLYRGIAKYVNGLSGVKVASKMATKMDRGATQ